MANESIKKNTKIALEKETTQGTYVDPTSGASFVKVFTDGVTLNGARETLEMDLIGQGLSRSKSRVGLKSATGSLSLPMKAGSIPSELPEYSILLESLMGSVRQGVAVISDVGHSTNTIYIDDADISNFNVGDVVVVKEAGAYHTSPITAVDDSLGSANITLYHDAGSAFSDNVEIEAFNTYVPVDKDHPNFSVTKYVDDSIKETIRGCTTTSLSLESFSVGQTAAFNFAIEGLEFLSELEAPAYSPTYDTSETPIILEACIFQNGNKIRVSEFTLSVENTVSFLSNTCDGKESSRITNRAITGTINPYKLTNNVDDFNRFNANESFSLFISAHNGTGVDGEYREVVGFYLPECVINDLQEGDIEGVLTNNIAFEATSEDGSIKELYITLS